MLQSHSLPFGTAPPMMQPPLESPRNRPTEPLNAFWILISLLAICCSVGLFICAGFTGWRVSDGMEFRYRTNTGEIKLFTYGANDLGLCNFRFNNGQTTHSIHRAAKRLCASIVQYGSAQNERNSNNNNEQSGTELPASAPVCGEHCISHFTDRCLSYKKLARAGYVGLTTCIIGGVLALGGGVWTLMCQRSPCVLQTVWMGGGLGVVSSLIWWIYETDKLFQLLNSRSMYPYPSLGPACVSAVVVSGTLCLLGILVMAYGPFKNWRVNDENKQLSHMGSHRPSQLSACFHPGAAANDPETFDHKPVPGLGGPWFQPQRSATPHGPFQPGLCNSFGATGRHSGSSFGRQPSLVKASSGGGIPERKISARPQGRQSVCSTYGGHQQDHRFSGQLSQIVTPSGLPPLVTRMCTTPNAASSDLPRGFPEPPSNPTHPTRKSGIQKMATATY